MLSVYRIFERVKKGSENRIVEKRVRREFRLSKQVNASLLHLLLLQVKFLLLSVVDYPVLILSKYVKIHSGCNQGTLNLRKQLLIEDSNLSISTSKGSEVRLLGVLEEEGIGTVRSRRRKGGSGKGRVEEQFGKIEQVEGDLVERHLHRMARSACCLSCCLFAYRHPSGCTGKKVEGLESQRRRNFGCDVEDLSVGGSRQNSDSFRRRMC